MDSFLMMLNDVLIEQRKEINELEKADILSNRAFYRYSEFTPYLKTLIKIANYLNVSLDYLAGRITTNKFKPYRSNQKNFYSNLTQIMKQNKISQSKVAKDIPLGRTNFIYWKRGKLPKLNTLISLADYFSCNIDDFLDLE